jgi:hypothetical protein
MELLLKCVGYGLMWAVALVLIVVFLAAVIFT